MEKGLKKFEMDIEVLFKRSATHSLSLFVLYYGPSTSKADTTCSITTF